MYLRFSAAVAGIDAVVAAEDGVASDTELVIVGSMGMSVPTVLVILSAVDDGWVESMVGDPVMNNIRKYNMTLFQTLLLRGTPQSHANSRENLKNIHHWSAWVSGLTPSVLNEWAHQDKVCSCSAG